MNYSETQVNKLDYFFKSITNSNKDTSYYLNAMNNKSFSFSKKDSTVLFRSEHHYCNWSFISYLDMGNNFKSYSDRQWFYVTETNDPNYVQIRKDLVDYWAKNQKDTDKDTVLVVTPNGVVPVKMNRFFGFKPLSFKVEWNKDGNVIFKFDISSQKEVKCPEDYKASDETTQYIQKSAQYIGNCNYAEHRKSNKQLIVARYNDDNTLKCFHKMKSIKQVYDLLGVEGKMGISYKTFQRLINKNMVGYFFEIGGTKFWLKVEDPASNAIPETWGKETVEVSETSVEAINVSVMDNLVVEALRDEDTSSLDHKTEEVANYVVSQLENIRLSNITNFGPPERVFIRINELPY